MQNSKSDRRGAKRKSIGKRKHPDQDDSEELPTQQRSIADLFARSGGDRNSNNNKVKNQLPNSPSTKRHRPDSPLSSSPQLPQRSSDKMYNFPSSSDQKAVAGPAGSNQSGSDAQTAALRARAYNASPRPSNFTPHTGAKKLVVKNLRAIPRLNQESYFEKVWGQLDAALTAIFSDKKPTHSLEELYKGAENVCRQGRAAPLSQKLSEKCKEYISGSLRESILEKSDGGDDIDALRIVIDAWSTWNSRLVTIRSIFYYLDQSFLLHSKDNPVIYEMGPAQFRSYIFADRTLKRKILGGACGLVKVDRKGDNQRVDSSLLRQAITFFHSLGVYKNEFEPRFIEDSEAYFKDWIVKERLGRDLASFIDLSYGLIESELSRCETFGLDRATRQRLSNLLDQILIKQQEDVLLDKGKVLELLRKKNHAALKKLYSLLQRIDLGPKLRTAFETYIIEEGSSIVFDEERESDMVVRLLGHKSNLDVVWKDSFQKNETLGHALREAFETFINQQKKTQASWGTDNPKPGEMIAKHVDLLLKGGLKATVGRSTQINSKDNPSFVDEKEEINRQLDQVLDLFRFVHGKAVFEAFYKNDLARRLLMGRSASDDDELSMLARLETECGQNFTHNLKAMFTDMKLAREEMAAYKERHRNPLDLNVHILSVAAWPSYPDVEVNIPPEVSSALRDFDSFYNNKYNGRKLSWKHSLAHCQLKARFPKGDREIVVSSFQAIVLLLFNDVRGNESLSYEQLKRATALPHHELKRTLQSLACAKYRVLNKRPKGREVNESDVFTYNSDFTDQKMRIKINQIQLKETKEENKGVHERVAADRHYETQAAIVRIMKSRKTITHAELVAEVISATRNRGVLSTDDIKSNIEKLIEKDYLEREEGSNNRYKYLA
ncbi:hypothetical protein FQN54_006933 [Arachnomyces sp. PD_36]|nr:hypothetical protein FQN54_006933 [Arachnomyces sp. PD_36]